jgi:hypothetical protein
MKGMFVNCYIHVVGGIFFFIWRAAAQRGPWPTHSRSFLYHTQSVGLLWTSDQLVAETST